MKTDTILRKATLLARSGNYEGAIRTLEHEEKSYYNSFRYYYLLGACCLHAGDFGGALGYFRQARKVKLQDPLLLLGLAVLYLRRGETDQAVDFYLEVQERDPKNRTAKKALTLIRKHAGAEHFAAWLESGKLSSLYPPLPSAGFSARMVLIPAAVLFAVLLAGSGVLIRFGILPNPLNPRGSRDNIPGGLSQFSLSGEERNAPVEVGGLYRYILTRDQALAAYDQALSLFTAYRDEAAKINLNHILESNASGALKNKSRILLTFMEVPGFDTFRQGDNVPYHDVVQDPVLYRDVHVIWRGMATNVTTGENSTAFDFLVGYDTRKTLEGIVPVTFDKAVALNPERPLEVLGRLTPVSSGQGERIKLVGVAIHQSGRLENPSP
jgi:tetratricopeptide (TPR) repeat protein